MSDNDTLQRFVFENAPVRGELVHLDSTWLALLNREDYPQPVRDLLGEMMAASALLAATIKFEGVITLQVQGNGPISLLVVECTSNRTLRGLAHWEGKVPEQGLADQVGDARLVITIDPGQGKERYQGIVAMEGERFADALDSYLQRSEQLATRLWLAANERRAAGMLLQKLPGEEPDDDAWNRFQMLGGTLTQHELLTLSSTEVIRRLFHEEDLRLFEPLILSFRCSCSRERVEGALRGLGHAEVSDILDKEGLIRVTCEFCNQRYEFDAVDAEALFVDGIAPSIGPTRH